MRMKEYKSMPKEDLDRDYIIEEGIYYRKDLQLTKEE
jgi:hypothetical protein